MSESESPAEAVGKRTRPVVGFPDRMLRGLVVAAVVIGLLLAGFVVMAACVKKAGPGEVGIKVNLAGDKRGVDQIPIQTGWIFYNPLTQTVFVYPTYVQTYTWTKDATEGSPTDESMTFNSKEGLSINADISLAFKLEPDRVPLLYTTYRKSIEQIIHTYLRSAIRQAFVNQASTMAVDEIYGEKKAWLCEQVTRQMNDHLGAMGFQFDYITFVGELRLPDNVRESINAKIEATQRAIRAENELREAQAEAKKKVAAAEGEAQAVLIRSKAEAEANRILVQSLGGSENYVRLKTIEKLGDKIEVMLLPSNSMPIVGLDRLLKPQS